jgi:hypothetical protein
VVEVAGAAVAAVSVAAALPAKHALVTGRARGVTHGARSTVFLCVFL